MDTRAARQVMPVTYPELVPLCSLDAVCLSALTQQVGHPGHHHTVLSLLIV
jgi:hypothetical protein